jgi:hypothetical protein
VHSKKAVTLNITNDDPVFVAYCDLANKAVDHLHDTLLKIIPLPQDGRTNIYLHQWTIYLGTVLEESAIAATQLLLLDMPRAAVLLNRQVFEYSVRLRYLYSHEDVAVKLMDSLQWRVKNEAERAPDYFSEDLRKRYAANYEAWSSEHPGLETSVSEDSFTQMARDVLGNRFAADFFRLYSYPSIIAHGKPHGIIDVLMSEDGGGVKRHYWDSRTVDTPTELSKTTSLVLEFAAAIRIRYGLDLDTIKAMDELHAVTQADYHGDLKALE